MIDKVVSKIDDIYGDFLAEDTNKDQFCKQLAQALNCLPLENGPKKFEVNIVNQKRTEPFFGFRVFAVMNEMNHVTDEFINKSLSLKELCEKWKKIPNWYMEIDAQAFDRNEINFTPKELTAMTLHEIGHVIYSSKPIEYFYNAYTDAKRRAKLSARGAQKVLYSLYMVPLSIACMQKHWVNNKNEISIEFFADSYLKNFGYAESLLSAFNKIIIAHGSINESENEKISKVENAVNWCNVNVVDLERRKNHLKDELFQKSIRSSSPFFKGVCVSELRTLGAKLRERYTGAVVEVTLENVQPGMFETYQAEYDFSTISALERACSAVAMSTATEAAKYAELPKQFKIDRLAVEADRVTNHSDRIHVLDMIYRESLKLEQFMEAMDADRDLKSRYGGKVESMSRQLEEIRANVLSKHSFNKEYKFFVKYPNGYEG